jgi:hypothetical protein
MMDFLVSVEQSGFTRWVRDSGSLLGYPSVLTIHTVGLAILVGTSTFVALRLLGVGRGLPIERLLTFYPTMWVGFAINAVSGVILFMVDATERAVQPVFYVKLGLIALALLAQWRLRAVIAKDSRERSGESSRDGRTIAALVLVLWAAAITAGRLMAYVNDAPPTFR